VFAESVTYCETKSQMENDVLKFYRKFKALTQGRTDHFSRKNWTNTGKHLLLLLIYGFKFRSVSSPLCICFDLL